MPIERVQLLLVSLQPLASNRRTPRMSVDRARHLALLL